MDDVDVAIVGAGPTGLALACELRLAGVRCRVLERRTDEPNLTRAFAVHARTLELLDAPASATSLSRKALWYARCSRHLARRSRSRRCRRGIRWCSSFPRAEPSGCSRSEPGNSARSS